MIAQAQRQPHTGFIGVEPFVNGMAKALAGIESSELRNIRLHFDDAAEPARVAARGRRWRAST